MDTAGVMILYVFFFHTLMFSVASLALRSFSLVVSGDFNGRGVDLPLEEDGIIVRHQLKVTFSMQNQRKILDLLLHFRNKKRNIRGTLNVFSQLFMLVNGFTLKRKGCGNADAWQ